MMKRAVLWFSAAIALLVAIGCGSASGAKVASPGYAGADRDADGIQDSTDAEPDTAVTGGLYQVPAEAPMREEAGDEAEMAAPVAKAPPPAPPPGAGATGPQPPDIKPKPDVAPGQPQPAGPTVDTGSDKKLAGPMLIYTANVHLAVFEAKKSIDQAEQIAKEAGGYLVRRDDLSITVRVPAGKFDGALAKMLKLGDVLHRDVSVKDVTAEYFDLAVRLKNAEAVRDRLQELLKKATNVSDAIQVERELARVTGEIESMKGRLKLLRELVTFSTITLRFEARPTESIDSKVRLPFPWLDQLGLSNLLRL
jgi:hypothetical protein